MLLLAAAIVVAVIVTGAFGYSSMLYAGLRNSGLRRGAQWLRCVPNLRVFSSAEQNSWEDGASHSSRFEIDRDNLLNTLKQFGTDMREKPDNCIQLKECKLCNKGNRLNADNLWKLNVWPTGSYNCFRCASSGNWYDLKHKAATFAEETQDSNVNVHVYSPSGGRQVSASVSKPADPFVIPSQYIAMRPYNNLFPNEKRLAKDTDDDVFDRLEVKKYLSEVRGLNDETLQKYGVGFAHQEFLNNENEWQDELCITFPWKMPRHAVQGMNLNFTNTGDAEGKSDLIVRLKYRALTTKGLQRISPKGGMWGFFGWHTVPSGSSTASSESAGSTKAPGEIIITEGEYDAMAVSQGLSTLPEDDPLRSIPAVSVPNGCSSLPAALLPLLEPFTKIYLWLDNDKSGQEACEKFLAKLGRHRCVIVRPQPDDEHQPKDANDALRLPVPGLIPALIRSAHPAAPDVVTSFAQQRESILRAFESSDQDGTQCSSLPALSGICKGFRRGELVIVSGPTGSGKTTLLSQLGLDFAQQGRPILWGSFELPTDRLMGKMMQQFHKAGKLKSLSKDKLNKVANDFEALPIRFLNFHDASNIDEFISAMDHAVFKDDIQHIIIDSIKSLLPRAGSAGGGTATLAALPLPTSTTSYVTAGTAPLPVSAASKVKRPSSSDLFERYRAQDEVIDRLRAFATQKNVNILLVIHPKKEAEDVRLTMASIVGSAKATQEADLVMLLQKYGDNQYIEVKKNRFDGVTGKVDVSFNETTTCYEEVPDSCITSRSGGYRSSVKKVPDLAEDGARLWPTVDELMHEQCAEGVADQQTGWSESAKQQEKPRKVYYRKSALPSPPPKESTPGTAPIGESEHHADHSAGPFSELVAAASRRGSSRAAGKGDYKLAEGAPEPVVDAPKPDTPNSDWPAEEMPVDAVAGGYLPVTANTAPSGVAESISDGATLQPVTEVKNKKLASGAVKKRSAKLSRKLAALAEAPEDEVICWAALEDAAAAAPDPGGESGGEGRLSEARPVYSAVGADVSYTHNGSGTGGDRGAGPSTRPPRKYVPRQRRAVVEGPLVKVAVPDAPVAESGAGASLPCVGHHEQQEPSLVQLEGASERYRGAVIEGRAGGIAAGASKDRKKSEKNATSAQVAPKRPKRSKKAT